MSRVGIGRVRYALGDGATEAQARGVHRMLAEAGLLDPEFDPSRIMGLAEVAELAGRSKPSVLAWTRLEPVARIKSGPIYDRVRVEAFLRDHPHLVARKR